MTASRAYLPSNLKGREGWVFRFQIDMVHLVAVLKEVSFFLATAMLCHPLRWKGGQTSACLSACRLRVWATRIRDSLPPPQLGMGKTTLLL